MTKTDDSPDFENQTNELQKSNVKAPNGKYISTVSKRNARERHRIKTVNAAFDDLRKHVPSGRQAGKKISKVETLKSAIEYIKALQEILKEQEQNSLVVSEELQYF